VHACVAQAFFCMAALAAVVTSRWWLETTPRAKTTASRRLVALACVSVGAIYLQLIFGAVMRHDKAGLAIPDYPLHYGHVVPRTDAQSMARINEYRVLELNLERVEPEQVWIHFTHRTWAYAVSVLVLALAGHVVCHNRADGKLLVPAVTLVGLLGTQVTLGILTVLWKKPADVASLHVAVGALTLLTTFVLAVRAARLYGGTAVERAGEVDDRTRPAPGGREVNVNPLPV
jgi:cytochrome c oxidase assembly protein subunit 15